MSRFISLSALIFASLLLPASANEEVVVLKLRAQAGVSATNYTLGEVAAVMANSDLKSELEKMPLGIAPRLGYPEAVSRARILKFIESRHPELRGRIGWQGGKSVTVRSIGVQFDRQNIIAAARDFLYARLTPEFEPVEVTPVGKIDDLYHPAGAFAVVPRINDAERLNKRMCVWLDVAINGEHYRSIPVWFAVSAYKTVWVAKNDLPVRHVITADDFAAEQRDIAGISAAVFSDDLNSVWLKKPMTAGAVFLTENVEQIPPVRRAQDVRVKVISGKVELETRGIALQDGKIGQRVQIARHDNAKIYFAQVQGEGMVLVDGR